MLALLTAITAGLYAALIAYMRVPTAVVYLGFAVAGLGLALVTAQSLRMMRFTRILLVCWRDPERGQWKVRALADEWSTAALWAAFGALLLTVALIIEGIFLYLVFPDLG
jgi:hypothetical protein